MVIPDPSASDVPTHHWRTQLRADGLILDQFQLNRRWSENETKHQIIDKLPHAHRIADIKFMKASYGKLTDFNLQDEVPLTCDRLLRLSGQGAIYAQCIDKFPNSIEEDNEEEDNAEKGSINGEDAFDLELLETVETPPINGPSMDGPCASLSRPTLDDEDPCTSTANDSEKEPSFFEKLSTLQIMFPNHERDTLEDILRKADNLEEAADLVLQTNLSLESLLNQIQRPISEAEDLPITIDRTKVWRQCLGFYKMALADTSRLRASLKIEFLGEEGIDLGALKTEFFQRCIDEGLNNLFEDIGESKIPRKSAGSLLTFKLFGALIGHSIIQGGPGIGILPPWCYRYIATGSFESASELLTKDDIPLNAATALIHSFITDMQSADTDEKVEKLLDDGSTTGDVYQQIVNGSSWDITKEITSKNRGMLIFEVIVDEALRKRVPQLNAIMEGLESAGLLKHIKIHQDLMQPLFATKLYISSTLMKNYMLVKDEQLTEKRELVYKWFLDFIDSADTPTLVKLLQFATSLKSIPVIGLNPKICISFHAESATDKSLPEAAVCFRQMFLPVCHETYDSFTKFLYLALEAECEGFANL